MKTISDDPVATTNMEEGMPIQRKVSLSTPFEGLVVSKMSSIG